MADTPEPVQGWSAKRSLRYGAAALIVTSHMSASQVAALATYFGGVRPFPCELRLDAPLPTLNMHVHLCCVHFPD